MESWVDGRPASALSLLDRGLAYGDGLFETVLVRNGRPVLFERHLQRLVDGCTRLGMPLDLDQVREECGRFAVGLGEGVMKLIVTRGDGLRGYAPLADARPRRILQGSGAPVWPAAHAEIGVKLFACSTRLAEQPRLAGLKHLNRLEQVLARAEWQDATYAEGLVLDHSGRLIEGVFSNLFLVIEGTLCTPDLSRCGVAGVMRAELLAHVAERGLAAKVLDLSPEHLGRATEVFVCNSVYGIWPVIGAGELSWSVGPVTRKLQAFSRSILDS